tara:strand:- start:983 stop:1459 length:477 start_codon:yes stop_codon:yes gene_type:complete
MKNKIVLNTVLLISIFVLLSAYFIEYILGFKPCNLCLIERIPYFLAIIIILLGMSLKRLEKFIFLSLGFVFISSTILSFYHFGIEQNFFKESLVCVSNNEINILNKKDLLNELKTTVISCKDVEFKLFGLSLATINTIISLFLSVITLRLFFKYEKNR